jgi:hypothetical protein
MRRKNELFELFVVILFGWLSVKTLGLVLRLTWGLASIAATALLVLALPALLVGLLVAGGAILLLPLALVGGAFAILKACC